MPVIIALGFPGSSAGKESACNAGDTSLNPGVWDWEKGLGYPLQSSAWRIQWTVKSMGLQSQTGLSEFHFPFYPLPNPPPYSLECVLEGRNSTAKTTKLY